jgi:hypothetical protein
MTGSVLPPLHPTLRVDPDDRKAWRHALQALARHDNPARGEDLMVATIASLRWREAKAKIHEWRTGGSVDAEQATLMLLMITPRRWQR